MPSYRPKDLSGLEYGPVPIHILGHSGYWVQDLEEPARFYIKHFNFKPPDFMLDEKAKANTIFFYIGQGKEYSDHRSLVFGQVFGSMPPGPHHAAFEVNSIDHEIFAHDYLAEQRYKNFRGMGRHIEGSQVFDYWRALIGSWLSTM